MKKLFIVGVLALAFGQSWPAARAQSTPAKNTAVSAKDAPPAAALKVGTVAPDFSLEDEQGRQVKLSATRGRTPTLIFFFRGWW